MICNKSVMRPRPFLGCALGDVGGCDSRYNADLRDGDDATGVSKPEALRVAAAEGGQDPAEVRSIM
jgi:hypothetical protein